MFLWVYTIYLSSDVGKFQDCLCVVEKYPSSMTILPWSAGTSRLVKSTPTHRLIPLSSTVSLKDGGGKGTAGRSHPSIASRLSLLEVPSPGVVGASRNCGNIRCQKKKTAPQKQLIRDDLIKAYCDL